MREQSVGATVIVGLDAPTGPLFRERRTSSHKGAVPPVCRIGASRRRPGRHPHPPLPRITTAAAASVVRHSRERQGRRRHSPAPRSGHGGRLAQGVGAQSMPALDIHHRIRGRPERGEPGTELRRVGGRGETDGCDHAGAQGVRHAFQAVARAPAGAASTSWRASGSWVPRMCARHPFWHGGTSQDGGRTVGAAGSRRAAAEVCGKAAVALLSVTVSDCRSTSRAAAALRIRRLRPVIPAGTSARARRRVMRQGIG
ncbi:hypothetical protein SAMN05216533_8456 [Streptomyces sp. Ag109_O5-10]|nr:hypothetical protein SAMN05216533_8456 [Streptomyces sp. Ag109_O5-10]